MVKTIEKTCKKKSALKLRRSTSESIKSGLSGKFVEQLRKKLIKARPAEEIVKVQSKITCNH